VRTINEQAEEILLGSILKDNSILEEITLSPEQFLDLTNQNIYKAMLSVKRKGFPIDGASLKDELGETGFLFIGGNERLIAYMNCVPSVHAFKSYEQMIINQWKISTAKDLMREVIEGELNVEQLQTLIKDLNKIDEEGAFEEFNLKNELQELYEEITIETPKKRSGIPSGYVDIDNKTDGFQPSDLIIVGARPSMGKTAFILNLAINAAAKANAIPIIFSLEMTKKKLLKRMQSAISEVNGMKLKNTYHYTNDEEKEKLKKSLRIIEGISPTIYDKAGQKVSEMRAKIRKIKHTNPGREIIVFIDYLTKIKPSRDFKGNMHQEITEISQDLKDMAKDFNIPVVCLAQLNRGVEQRPEKRPMKSDLRESGSIEQDADIIMMLYRDEYYNPETELKNVLEVDISKNRDGIVGAVKLQYKKEINKIENLYHYHMQKQ
jgi:replicative DNA helicase